MRIYRLHEFSEIPCDFPHTDFADDLKKLFEIRTNQEQFNLFINNHSVEYLRNLIQSYTPILRQHLVRAANYQHRSKQNCGITLRSYFRELDRRKQEREAEQRKLALATNGHTDTKQ